MRVIVTENYEEMSRVAANIIIDIVKSNPEAVLGLATGSSPIGTYDNMVKDHKENGTSYKNVKTVNLDEYVSLAPEHDQSYAYFMRKNLFDRVDIDLANTNLPSGIAPDAQAECDRYNSLLDTVKQDVQLLGLGSNGHIGFNEPDSELIPNTHLTALTDSTIEANSRFFASENDVPKHALTMGIASVFKARKIIVVASGANKAEAIRATLCGNLTTNCPASLLRLHPDVTIICDEAAYSLCK